MDRTKIIKAYGLDEGQYVPVEDKEIGKLAAASSKNLETVAFTKLQKINPIFFDASYFCIPEESRKKDHRAEEKTWQRVRLLRLNGRQQIEAKKSALARKTSRRKLVDLCFCLE